MFIGAVCLCEPVILLSRINAMWDCERVDFWARVLAQRTTTKQTACHGHSVGMAIPMVHSLVVYWDHFWVNSQEPLPMFGKSPHRMKEETDQRKWSGWRITLLYVKHVPKMPARLFQLKEPQWLTSCSKLREKVYWNPKNNSRMRE